LILNRQSEGNVFEGIWANNTVIRYDRAIFSRHHINLPVSVVKPKTRICAKCWHILLDDMYQLCWTGLMISIARFTILRKQHYWRKKADSIRLPGCNRSSANTKSLATPDCVRSRFDPRIRSPIEGSSMKLSLQMTARDSLRWCTIAPGPFRDHLNYLICRRIFKCSFQYLYIEGDIQFVDLSCDNRGYPVVFTANAKYIESRNIGLRWRSHRKSESSPHYPKQLDVIGKNYGSKNQLDMATSSQFMFHWLMKDWSSR